MSKKIDKDTLKAPDVFVSTSDKVFNFIERHLKLFLGVIGVALILSLGYVLANYMVTMKEHKAAEALYAPEAELKKAESDTREAKMKTAIAKKAAKPDQSEAPAENFAKDYAHLVEKIKAAIKAHSDTKAAVVSALNLSYFLTRQHQFAQALEVLQIPTFHPHDGELLTGFWYMHRGVVLLENNQVDPAIDAYSNVLKAEALKPFYPEALLKLGVCYELKGDMNKARETYEKIGHDFPESEASSQAQQYLRLMDLNTHKQG